MTQHPQYSALTIAQHFAYLAKRHPTTYSPMTPLKLQKLLYYAEGHSLASFDRSLFTEPIEAWQWGPVIPSVYHNYKKYEGNQIPPPSGYDPDSIDAATAKMLLQVYRRYAVATAMELSAMTHREWAWRQTPQGAEIDRNLIKATFSRMLHVPEATKSDSFTPAEREWVLDSVIASQAMEGVIISREDAERLLDDLEGQPMPNIV